MEFTRRHVMKASAATSLVMACGGIAMAGGQAEVKGYCHPDFQALREAYAKSFATGEELGGAVSVMIDGETVVDLWGGYKDVERRDPWLEDTLVCTMSVSKGISAICAQMLIDRGKLDPDEKVSTYWPEFGQAGKENITVRDVLSHKAALPVADAAAPGDALKYEPLIKALEVQEPIWEPGTKGTYHATTYGHLVGEIVRRVSGKRIEDFIRSELAEPLSAEFIIGCNDAEYARVAPPIPNPKNELTNRGRHPEEISQRIYRLLGSREVLGSRDFCRTIFPSASGISNARSLARIFGALARGGSLNGYKVMSPETLAEMTKVQWDYEDPIHHDPFKVSMGYVHNGKFSYYGPNPRSFGTLGSGGYGVFADPDRRMSFAYTPVRFTSGYGLGDQPRRLIDVLYTLV